MLCLALQSNPKSIFKYVENCPISEHSRKEDFSFNYNNWKQAEHHQKFSDNASWSYMEQKSQTCQTLLHYRFLNQAWMGTTHLLQLDIGLVSPSSPREILTFYYANIGLCNWQQYETTKWNWSGLIPTDVFCLVKTK